MQYFFEEIVILTKLENTLQLRDLEEQEIEELLNVAKASVHHSVMDFILCELQTEDEKLEFLRLAENTDPKTTINTLTAKIEEFREKLHQVISSTEEQIIKLLA